jgi:hypothetical protein
VIFLHEYDVSPVDIYLRPTIHYGPGSQPNSAAEDQKRIVQ